MEKLTLKEKIQNEFDSLKCYDIFSLNLHELKNGSVKIRIEATESTINRIGWKFSIIRKIIKPGDDIKLSNEIKEYLKRLRND